MFLIACDPAYNKEIAFAIFENGQLLECRKIKPTIENLVEFFSNFKNRQYSLVVEGQYLKFNTKIAFKLVEIRTVIETIAYLNNCLCIYENILPSVWKRHFKTKMSEDTDTSDAINIGLYVLKNYQNIGVKNGI